MRNLWITAAIVVATGCVTPDGAHHDEPSPSSSSARLLATSDPVVCDQSIKDPLLQDQDPLFTRPSLTHLSSKRLTAAFELEPLGEVILEIESFFGIKILRTTMVSDQVVTVKMNQSTLDETLDLITMSAGLEFRYLEARKAVIIASPDGMSSRELDYRLVYRPRYLIPSVVMASLAPGYKKLMTANDDAGTIVIEAPGRRLQAISQILNQVDVPPRQVVLHLGVIELDRTRLEDMGRDLTDRSALGLLDSLSPLAPAFRPSILTGAAYRSFLGTVLALEDTGVTRIKAQPKLMTQDAHRAVFKTVRRSRLDDDTSIRANRLLIESPTELIITPYFETDTQIRLEVERASHAEQDVTTFGDHESSVSTRTAVYLGDTVVIGGMIHSRVDEQKSSWAGMGDIPYIGWLFRRSVKRTRLIETIFTIRPEAVCRPHQSPQGTLSPS